ncbi:MAG TPA: hypothetical protein VGP12_01935 [Nitrosospira sp.]|nr:hypothetical protein [Nitrosospira sp.]
MAAVIDTLLFILVPHGKKAVHLVLRKYGAFTVAACNILETTSSTLPTGGTQGEAA